MGAKHIIAADLTIVIPVRNRAGMIGRLWACVCAQTVLPGRVIAVDNGSTDGTLPALRALEAPAGMRLDVLTEPQPGACAARNRGLREVTSRWTMFFDSDDEMLPGHVERALATAAAHPDATIVGWDVTYRRGGTDTVKPFATDDAQWQSLMHGTMATQRYMARTEAFRAAGGWDNRVRIWNDIELGARLLAANPVIVKSAGKPTVIVNAGADSITGPGFASRIGLYDAALDAIATTLGGERGRRWTALKRAILAGDIIREGHPGGREMAQRAIAAAPQLRLPLRAACLLKSHGVRGVARLLKPIIK